MSEWQVVLAQWLSVNRPKKYRSIIIYIMFIKTINSKYLIVDKKTSYSKIECTRPILS